MRGSPAQDLEPPAVIFESLGRERCRTHQRDALVLLSHPREQARRVVRPKQGLAARGYAYDHGEFLELEEIRIPLVIAGPGVTPGRSSEVASIRDLYTTLLVAAGVGDSEAGSAGRRDLRRATGESRFVAVERRQLFKAEVHGVGAARSEALRLHALAVTDGSNTVVLDVAGQASSPSSPPPELLEVAHRRWSQIDTASRRAPSHRIDPSTREALRALGYADPGEDPRR